MWEDEVSPHEMQYWRRDIKNFVAELTVTDPMLSRVIKWFKYDRFPARDSLPEGLLTRLFDKGCKNELTVLRHPNGDPDLPQALMVKDGGKHKLVLPEACVQVIIQSAHRMTGHGGVDKTRAVLKDIFWKPGLAKDIVDTLDECIP